ncbi:hypothetical protein BD413DRAFT_231158 [Trametes elegans]|nr:hypothetical protein BD413DRAFT_231158 [Trametes elegans]
MRIFKLTVLVSLCAVATGSYALLTPARDSNNGPVCPGARAVSASSVAVGSKTVELTTFACDVAVIAAAHADDDPAPNTSAVPSATSIAPAAPIQTRDVCGEICINQCGDSGELPPTTEDCATIVDAITILNGSISPSFEVDPGHVQTLAFGTCRFFFENFSPFAMTSCWLSFSQTASAAASACLPPVQPVNSEGFCTMSDGSWRVGVAHS